MQQDLSSVKHICIEGEAMKISLAGAKSQGVAGLTFTTVLTSASDLLTCDATSS